MATDTVQPASPAHKQEDFCSPAVKSPAKVAKTPNIKGDVSFPHATVARMMKESHDIKVSSEAVHSVSKATELFIQLLAGEGAQVMEASKHKSLSYNHIAKVVNNSDRLSWLTEVAPEKEPASRYLPKGLQS